MMMMMVMVMMFWRKNLQVSPSISYQVQHAAVQPQAARACPHCLLKNTCLFASHFREKIDPFFNFIFRHSKSKQVVPLALHHTLSAQSTALRSVFYTDGCRLGNLFVSDIFPWQTE